MNDPELDDLETSCRLNYTLAKMKSKEWELVIEHSLKVELPKFY